MSVIFRVACIQLVLSAVMALAWGLTAGVASGLLVLAGGAAAAALSSLTGGVFMRRLASRPDRPVRALLRARAVAWLVTLLLLLVVLKMLGSGGVPFLAGFSAATLGFLFALLWK